MVNGVTGAIVSQVPTLVAVRIFKESLGVARGKKRKVKKRKMKKKVRKKMKKTKKGRR